MKKYRFSYHYNKQLSKQSGKNVWSIHYNKRCIFVENIVCNVPTETKQNKTQPFATVQGFAESIEIVNGIAKIN